MKRTLFIFCFALFFISSFSQTKKFTGAWFEVRYPSNFQVHPSLHSTTNNEGFESAFFTSPDEAVTFYIFSPQWFGEPTDIALKDSEKVVSTKTLINGNKTTKLWTITSKDGSYTRSYQETIENNGATKVNWVSGVGYKNETAYNRYKNAYLQFKSSLHQFAD